MVVIEVFTPVVQRILKHNMVSDWTASGGWAWRRLFQELRLCVACSPGLCFSSQKQAGGVASIQSGPHCWDIGGTLLSGMWSGTLHS